MKFDAAMAYCVARITSAGRADLAGRGEMIHTLDRLRTILEPSHLPSLLTVCGIKIGLVQFLASIEHPPEERIAALRLRFRLQLAIPQYFH